jgi:hypothetical protein
MSTKHVCGFIGFNLLSFLSFTLMSMSLVAGFLCLLFTIAFGMRYLHMPVSQRHHR